MGKRQKELYGPCCYQRTGKSHSREKQQGCLYQEIWTYCKTEKDPNAVRNHGKLSEQADKRGQQEIL